MASVKFRRVVTGHDSCGAAKVLLDGEPPNVRSFNSLPGTYFTEVWSTSRSPAIVNNADDPTVNTTGIRPPAGGSVIRVIDFPPETTQAAPSVASRVFAEIGSTEDSTAVSGSRNALMHRTESIDYGIVLEGRITLILDDSEVELKQGDIVVQRGTNHAWSNRSGALCRMAFILLDGRYAPEIKAALTTQLGAGA